MLKFCYVLAISPLLLFTDNKEALKEALKAGEIHRLPRQKHFSHQRVNREQASALVQAVLDGREAPMGVRQLERQLGLGPSTLSYHFPQECALVTSQYQAYRAEQTKQRMEQGYNEIRLATLNVHKQGINPSANQVARKLSDPGMMRTPEGLDIWHTTRCELGLET